MPPLKKGKKVPYVKEMVENAPPHIEKMVENVPPPFPGRVDFAINRSRNPPHPPPQICSMQPRGGVAR